MGLDGGLVQTWRDPAARLVFAGMVFSWLCGFGCEYEACWGSMRDYLLLGGWVGDETMCVRALLKH